MNINSRYLDLHHHHHRRVLLLLPLLHSERDVIKLAKFCSHLKRCRELEKGDYEKNSSRRKILHFYSNDEKKYGFTTIIKGF